MQNPLLELLSSRKGLVVCCVIVLAFVCLAVTVLGIIPAEKRKRARAIQQAAIAAQEQQARDKEAREQTAEAVRKAEEQQAIEKHQQQEIDAENAEELRERSLTCVGVERCVVVTVLKAMEVIVTTSDGNGYKHQVGAPLQRVATSVGGPRKGNGIMMHGLVFDGNGARADLLCLQNCFDLKPGSTHYMGMGRFETHWRPCSDGGEGTCYDNVPYLSIGNSKWQVLELCSGRASDQCFAISTVNSRE